MVGGGLGAGEVIHVVTVGEGDTLRISKVFTVLAMAADALIASSCQVVEAVVTSLGTLAKAVLTVALS